MTWTAVRSLHTTTQRVRGLLLWALLSAAAMPAVGAHPQPATVRGNEDLEVAVSPSRSGSLLDVRDRMVSRAAEHGEEIGVIIQLEERSGVTAQTPGAASAAAVRRHRVQVVGEVAVAVVAAENHLRLDKGLAPADHAAVVRHTYTTVLFGLAASVHRDAIKEIEALPAVKRIEPDRRRHAMLDASVPLIQADRVWTELGYDGTGTTVAVIDTGIDYTQPDLGGCFGDGCKVKAGFDAVDDDEDPLDENGHGTHVAGIVAANGTLQGVAPGAELLAVRVLDAFGAGFDSDIIAGIEWAVDPDQDPETADGADVLNLSLGGGGYADDPLAQAVDAAVEQGAVVVVAAGNEGPSYKKIGSPGSARRAITVGASDLDDAITPFSSRGPGAQNFGVKPDLLAPGAEILSTVPTGDCDLCDPTGYRRLNGTSMASPHVAGAAALLVQAHPDWTPQQVKSALVSSGVSLDLDVFTQGSGRVDVLTAASSSTLIAPVLLSFGIDSGAQTTFSASRQLSIENLAEQSRSYELEAAEDLPQGVSFSITPSTLELDPGQEATVQLDIAVDNQLVSTLSQEPLAYQGALVMSTSSESHTIPFVFFRAPVLELQFTDELPFEIQLYSRTSIGFEWLLYSCSPMTMLLPANTYDIAFHYNKAWVFRENVEATGEQQLEIAVAEAVHSLELHPRDEQGLSFEPSGSVSTSMMRHTPSGWAFYTLVSNPEIGPELYSDMSDAFLLEKSLMLNKADGSVYTVHCGARQGMSGSLSCSVDPQELEPVTVQYRQASGQDLLLAKTMYSQPPQAPLSLALAPDCGTVLSPPFRQQLYLQPIPYPEFSLGYLKHKAYRLQGDPEDLGNRELLYESPLFTAAGQRTLNGYLFNGFLSFDVDQCLVPDVPSGLGSPSTLELPVFSRRLVTMPAGIGPYSWNGRFINSEETISLAGALGSRPLLFVSQLGDADPRATAAYRLLQDGTVIQEGSLSPGDLWPYALPVDPGSWVMELSSQGFEVAGTQSSSTVTATFDTQAGDPNPPFFTQFALTKNGHLKDSLPPSGGTLDVGILDEGELCDVSVAVAPLGGAWRDCDLTSVAAGSYRAEIPAFAPGTTRFTVRVAAEDSEHNSIVFATEVPVIEPAPRHSSRR